MSANNDSIFTILSENKLTIHTHRPEIFMADGKVYVAVVWPRQMGDQYVKHYLIELDSNLNEAGFGFPLTWKTEEYGEPSDHRVLYINDILYVVYQNNVFEGVPIRGNGLNPRGPMEKYSKEQSLLMRAFNMKGEILMEKALIPHVTDFSQDNFPDFCILHSNNKFYVSTGTRGGNRGAHVRIFDSNWNFLEKKAFTGGFGSIGNSLMADGDQFHILTTFNRILYVFTYDDQWNLLGKHNIGGSHIIETFPTGIEKIGERFYVSHIGSDEEMRRGLPTKGFNAYLRKYDLNWNMQGEVKVCEGGFLHTHPTFLFKDNRFLYAASRQSTEVSTPGRKPPQVSIFVVKEKQ